MHTDTYIDAFVILISCDHCGKHHAMTENGKIVMCDLLRAALLSTLLGEALAHMAHRLNRAPSERPRA